MSLPEWIMPYRNHVAWFVVLLAIGSIGLDIYAYRKRILTEKELNRLTCKAMLNAWRSVVILGCDLSLAEAYKDTIRQLTKNGKIVEVFYELDHVADADPVAVERFDCIRNGLEAAGARVYDCTFTHNMRCVLIDIEMDDLNDGTCVITAERVAAKTYWGKRVKRYRTHVLRREDENNASIFASFRLNYRLLKESV